AKAAVVEAEKARAAAPEEEAEKAGQVVAAATKRVQLAKTAKKRRRDGADTAWVKDRKVVSRDTPGAVKITSGGASLKGERERRLLLWPPLLFVVVFFLSAVTTFFLVLLLPFVSCLRPCMATAIALLCVGADRLFSVAIRFTCPSPLRPEVERWAEIARGGCQVGPRPHRFPCAEPGPACTDGSKAPLSVSSASSVVLMSRTSNTPRICLCPPLRTLLVWAAVADDRSRFSMIDSIL
ncbi:unnamed protein product, partial [Pylaiella littoralis]